MSFASLRLGPRVPAARAPHARPPPCYLRLARVMKAPPRPLSQKRAAEGLQGRVRRARVYVLSLAAGAARRSTPSSSGDHEPPESDLLTIQMVFMVYFYLKMCKIRVVL